MDRRANNNTVEDTYELRGASTMWQKINGCGTARANHAHDISMDAAHKFLFSYTHKRYNRVNVGAK